MKYFKSQNWDLQDKLLLSIKHTIHNIIYCRLGQQVKFIAFIRFTKPNILYLYIKSL